LLEFVAIAPTIGVSTPFLLLVDDLALKEKNMGHLRVFNFISLDGYYKGTHDETSWHRHGSEEGKHAENSLNENESILIFGRKTYEMMSAYWPTSMANEATPNVARGMNDAKKIVFSRTLTKATWQNTRLFKGDMIAEIKKLLKTQVLNLTILGSGSIATQLAAHNLIDEFQFMIDPVILGGGTSIFSGLPDTINLKLTNCETFSSGVVLVNYSRIK
jgi:dihydrofolate reductase